MADYWLFTSPCIETKYSVLPLKHLSVARGDPFSLETKFGEEDPRTSRRRCRTSGLTNILGSHEPLFQIPGLLCLTAHCQGCRRTAEYLRGPSSAKGYQGEGEGSEASELSQ